MIQKGGSLLMKTQDQLQFSEAWIERQNLSEMVYIMSQSLHQTKVRTLSPLYTFSKYISPQMIRRIIERLAIIY